MLTGCRAELGELSESNIWVGRGLGRAGKEEVTERKGPGSSGPRRWVCAHGHLCKRGSTGAEINKINGPIASAKPKETKK